MTVNNKLKIAILAILSSQSLYAITFDPLQIQSAPGELLYAEMSFHQADSNARLEVSLATPDDLRMLGATHQPPAHLNFFTRRNNRGEGVIVVTSTRPMLDPELNIILKIQEGSASHLKHIRQPIRQNAKVANNAKSSYEKSLTPKFIVSEKDIALNLPESTQFNTTTQPSLKQEKLLNAPFVLPPVLNISETRHSATATATATIEQAQIKEEINSTAKNQANTNTLATQTATDEAITQSNTTANESKIETAQAEVKIEQASEKAQKQPLKEATKPKAPTNQQPASANAQQHVVQRNESLWSIAQRISAQTQQPLHQVMHQIKQQNEHAFIGGNANRLRQGSHLNFNLNSVPVRKTPPTSTITAQSRIPAEKAKYRLQQAEMTLVAESNQDSSTGSAKKDTLQQKSTADLSLKVMTAREKTVTLQKNVTQLELALRQKEQRIQLLNARLAALQDQLKAQQEAKNSAH